MTLPILILRNSETYPCQWTYLINEDTMVPHATVYTLREARADTLRPIYNSGIALHEDGIYDIVLNCRRLTATKVRDALVELTKITGIEYVLLDF